MQQRSISNFKDTIGAVVLAAGWSSRMGAFKPLLSFGDGTVLSQVVGVLRQAGIARIHVVIGHKADMMESPMKKLNVFRVLNPDFASGMTGSARVGIASLPDDVEGCLILPVDLPLLRSQTINRVVRAAADSGAAIVRPTFRGQQGHPPFIGRRLFPRILADNADEGLCNILGKIETETKEVAVFDSGCLRDMDYPRDYRDLSEALSRRHVPDLEERDAMLLAAGASEAVRSHGRAVADLAVAIAQRLLEAGLALDLSLVQAAGHLHDIAKGQPHHAEAGAAMIMEFGYPKIAEVVACHMSLDLKRHLIDESAVVYLADKLIRGDQQVSLEQRFASAFARWGGDASAIAGARKRQADAETILQAVIARGDMNGVIAASTLAAADGAARGIKEAQR